MTTTPFDDPTAFDRRWANVDSRAIGKLASADPLLFIADHIQVSDRREGTVAVALRLFAGQSSMLVVPDAPPNPSDAQCLTLLGQAIEGSPNPACALGVVHHRRGSSVVSDSDRRWALALKAVSMAFDVEPLGVMARLYDGGLVRVPVPDELPVDYLAS